MPFCSSLLVVCGLMLLKRAQDRGISAWTCMILLSWVSAVVFAGLWALGGQIPSPGLIWQPTIIGGLFLAGQFFTFLAVRYGDVSIAAPVLGVKVLLVPAAATLLVAEWPAARIFVAAAIATTGIACVQITDVSAERARIVASVVLAVLAAISMTTFDLLIQRWAPAWGAGRFLPLAFVAAALCSLAFLPLANRPAELAGRQVLLPLIAGCVLMAVQAIGMTYTLAQFGDASRVNIVYSLRGLWGVGLTWLLLHRLPAAHPRPSQRIMLLRLFGALLLGVAVVIAVA